MNNKITFPRLATMLADASGRSKRFSEDFLREFFTLISEQLESGDSVKIKGFGTFRLSRVEPRKSVDVTTGQPMEISSHSKVVFIPAKELADAVNTPFEAFTAVEIDDNIDLQSIELDEIPQPREDVESDVEETIMEDITDYTPDNEGMPEDESTPEEEVSDEGLTEKVLTEEYPVEKEESSEDETSVEEENTVEDESQVEDNSPAEEENAVEDESALDDECQAEEEVSVEDDSHAEDEELAEDSQSTCSIGGPVSYNRQQDSNIRKNWTKGFLMGMLACLVLIIAGVGITVFLIWPDQLKTEWHNFFSSKDNVEQNDIKLAEATQTESSDVKGDEKLSENPDDTKSLDSEPAEVGKPTVANEEKVPTPPSDAVVYDTISKTRYLTTMAKAHYGNYHLWPIIYEENKAKLGHPDRIRPGTPVVIPTLSKYGIDPFNKKDVEKIKKMGIEIYARYGKKI